MVKRLFGTTIFFMFLVSLFVPRSVFALEELKLSMELWNRYTATIQNNAWTKRQFSLERGYLGLEPKLTDKISGRFTIDIYTDNKGDYKEAAGLKLKYAYLDFNGLIPIPDSKVSLGLVKHYFGFIYDWDYTTIEKSFEDVESVVKSTDYGMVLFGYLPMGLGEYALSMLNGEGYSKGGSSVNTQPSYEGNIRLIPLPGFQLGGSVLHTMDS
ncbi:MAG: hypothetical protein JW827_11570, partial [Spirochaetes bacterium]|nr:hypothetical protein [Spirochaetota bacterium]